MNRTKDYTSVAVAVLLCSPTVVQNSNDFENLVAGALWVRQTLVVAPKKIPTIFQSVFPRCMH